MSTQKFYVFFILLVGTAVCHAETFSQQLFYRPEYHKFQVVDPHGIPIPNASATFRYQSNFDISGMHTESHIEPIRFDKNGRASRLGFVRHIAHLTDIHAPGFYSRNSFYPEKDGEKIVMLPIKSPCPIFKREIWLSLEQPWIGKLQFRFSDLELSIQLNEKYRIARRWDKRKNSEVWQILYNEHYTPDLIFDFLPPQSRKTEWGHPYEFREITATFAEGKISDFQNHNSVFHGPYHVPYGEEDGLRPREPRWPILNVPFDDGFCRRAIMFSFMYQEKRCFGIVRRLNVDHPMNRQKTINFELELNLSGSTNMERNHKQPASHPQELLWRDGFQTIKFSPEEICSNFQLSPPPKIGLIQKLRSGEVTCLLYGVCRQDQHQLHYVEYYGKDACKKYLREEVFALVGAHQHELRDINFDGHPDLLLQLKNEGFDKENNYHRKVFLYTGDTFVYSWFFSQILRNGKYELIPEQQIIRVKRPTEKNSFYEQIYRVTSSSTIEQPILEN